LSDAFPVQNGMEKGDAFQPFFRVHHYGSLTKADTGI